MATKSIQDHLVEMQAAGHTLTDIVKAIDANLDNTQLAAMYLERYEADSGSCVPIVYKLAENKD
jgi:hypothetical protein